MNRLDVLLLYEPFGVESPSHMPEDMSMPEPEDVLPWLRRNTQACEHEYGKEPVNEIYNGWAITDLSVPEQKNTTTIRPNPSVLQNFNF